MKYDRRIQKGIRVSYTEAWLILLALKRLHVVDEVEEARQRLIKRFSLLYERISGEEFTDPRELVMSEPGDEPGMFVGGEKGKNGG